MWESYVRRCATASEKVAGPHALAMHLFFIRIQAVASILSEVGLSSCHFLGGASDSRAPLSKRTYTFLFVVGRRSLIGVSEKLVWLV